MNPETPAKPAPSRRRTKTSTSDFGVGRRESHDASQFYSRFAEPVISMDETVVECPVRNEFVCGDAANLDFIPDNSVALVVTSPPYFAASKQYDLDESHSQPADYDEYLSGLLAVYKEAVRFLEPGGRIAINVANLGRKPYRSLSSDIIDMLQNDLGLLLRAEIIWRKGEGASGSCAWGSFMQPTSPSIRDVTERIIIASKGRFDRAIKPQKRKELGLPYEATIRREEFMEYTLDVWNMRPESARKVGHPAPFPVELPRRLIELLTFKGDTCVDVMAGSGTVGLAAAMTGRNFVCVDRVEEYLEIGRRRVAEYEALQAAAS